MTETNTTSDEKIRKPIIPIITVPQPLHPSSLLGVNMEPQTELEMYKR